MRKKRELNGRKEKIIILTNIIKTGAEITGAIAGSAVGLIGGPAGIIAGGAAGILISKGLLDIVNRQISSREEIRIGAVATYSLIRINERLKNGEAFRKDNFFTEKNGIIKASELLEGVLLKSKSQYQEKKIQFISNIYTNTAFDQDITSENANQILNLAETITYRKMCILAFCKFTQTIKKEKRIRDSDYRGNYIFNSDLDLEFLLQDFMDLWNTGLVQRSDNTTLLDYSDVYPQIMELSGIGEIYYRLLGLQNIETEDLNDITEKVKEIAQNT